MHADQIADFAYEESYKLALVLVEEPFTIHDDDGGRGFTTTRLKMVRCTEVADYISQNFFKKP
jgi:hypothetical protein